MPSAKSISFDYKHGFKKSLIKSEKLKKAVELWCKYKNISKAAKEAGVSRMFLSRRLSGAVAMDSRNGPDPIFTPEEENLMASWLIEMNQRGFYLKPREFLSKVSEVLAVDESKRVRFQNMCPSHKWYYNFMARNCAHLRFNEDISSEKCEAGVTPQDFDSCSKNLEDNPFEGHSNQPETQILDTSQEDTTTHDVSDNPIVEELPLPKTQKKSTRKKKDSTLSSLGASNESIGLSKKQKNEKRGKQIRAAKCKNKFLNKSKKGICADESDDETICFVCQFPWSKDSEGTVWVQCSLCDKWQHIHCIPQSVDIRFVFSKDDFYCQNCH